ncbi:ABC-three component system middle component 2 [Rhizobium sp. BK176]|uniref:ABC-three component system middle component 2 n=1 Tax=Rhizobium sp. BK176 TaxID=2587071 RepID=UPI0021695B95|nr:ABC-three component system middle component 2 [Rhizobium sp. BK176]MCS4089053.1 hypothetical protein [Rhizobium sp. BK176]
MPSQEIKLYNGVLENAARVLLGLAAFHPTRLSMEETRIVDYFAAYGEDVGLETSLQDRVAWRGQVFGMRETMVTEAIGFLLAAGQVEGDDELGYRSIEESCMAIGLSEYLDEIFRVCCHMSDEAEKAGIKAYFNDRKADIESRIDVPLEGPPDDPGFHRFEQRQRKDIERMEGLEMTAFLFKKLLERSRVSEHPWLTREWLAAVQSAADKEQTKCYRTISQLKSMRQKPCAEDNNS